jgi:hypothetical protein
MIEQEIAGALAPAHEAGAVLVALSGPLSAGILGAIVAYFLERRMHAGWPATAGMRHGDLPATIVSWVCTGIGAAGSAAAAALRGRQRRSDALLVGQHAVSFLVAGVLARSIHYHGLESSLAVVVTSWALAAAGVGTLAASLALHLCRERGDGLFVGQWAPTFLGAALLVRLLGK